LFIFSLANRELSFGLVATEKGFNLYVGGNGGAKPRHAELLAKDVPPEEIVKILDRYLAWYMRTADKLQRTARWIEALPGGITYLKEVILDDKLGICEDLEAQMQELVGTYFDEWAEVLNNPDRRKHFQQFANTDESVETVEQITERNQQRPSDWVKESPREDFKNHVWTETSWQPIIQASHFSDAHPQVSSANVKRGDTQLAVFKIKGRYYATQQMCPHKRAFVLSDGLIGDDDKGGYWVSCPYHKRNYELNGAQAGRCASDETMNIATFPAEERDDGWVYLRLPSVEELDAVLGTQKWKVKASEAGQDIFAKVDKTYLKGTKSRKVVGGGLPVTRRAAVQGSIDW
jgi:nitrite reductase (NAD(P)H)